MKYISTIRANTQKKQQRKHYRKCDFFFKSILVKSLVNGNKFIKAKTHNMKCFL